MMSTKPYLAIQERTAQERTPAAQELSGVAHQLMDRIETLDEAVTKAHRWNTSFSAAILLAGILTASAILWFGYIQREKAIEESTNRQLELLAGQYAEQYRGESKKWKKKHPYERFRAEQLREAIRKEVSQEFEIAKAFKRNPHRS